MPGSGLIVGKNIPVAPTDDSSERRHRRFIADAANYANAAAFTPETQLAEFSSPVSLDAGVYTDLGVDLSITPYIPARAHVIFMSTVTFTGQAGAAIRILENGVEVIEFFAGGVDQTIPVAIQALRDLEPNTTYEYEVEAQEFPTSAGTVAVDSGTHTLRIEARRLNP